MGPVAVTPAPEAGAAVVARAELPCGIWDLPRRGIEPMSPALAGGFLITGPPRKSFPSPFMQVITPQLLELPPTECIHCAGWLPEVHIITPFSRP